MKMPECERLSAITDEWNAVAQFLDNSEFSLCEWSDRNNQYVPVHKTLTQVLAEYFDIDMDKVEAERSALLEEIRKQ
jgi:hypothetical protein